MNELIAVKLTISIYLLTLLFPGYAEKPIFNNAATATQVVKICHPTDEVQASQLSCDNHSQINIVVDENGIGTAKLDIRAAHLIAIGGGPNYTLPEGVDPLFVEYDLPEGGFDVIGPVNVFQMENALLDLYRSTVTLTFDFSSKCQAIPEQILAYSSNCRLVSSNNLNNPNPYYDIHYYADSGEIFTCEIFYETCDFNDCPSVPDYCEGGTEHADADLFFCVDCSKIGNQGNGFSGDSNEWISQSQSTRPPAKMSKEMIIKINRNPFQESFDLSMTINDHKSISILIYDARGTVVTRLDQAVVKGENDITIDSHQWQSGIYYAYIKGKDVTKILKLVKL